MFLIPELDAALHRAGEARPDRGLARAADAEGVLLDFEFDEFFTTHVAAVLAAADEDAAPAVYDRFSAMVLMESITTLTIHDGLLANRGNGDSADYQLTLPTSTST